MGYVVTFGEVLMRRLHRITNESYKVSFSSLAFLALRLMSQLLFLFWETK